MEAVPVELTTADGLVLRGERWGTGPDWLCLFHDDGDDLDSWRGLEPLLGERPEWSCLALDSRGHGGSDDPWDLRASVLDVEAAVAYARAAGARSVCAAGAGAGALAALAACREEELVNGLVLFSPGPLDAFPLEELRGPGVPKLIFTGTLSAPGTPGDPDPARAAAALMRASIGQPLVVNLPTDVQGTELIAGPWALQVLEHLAAFVDEQRVFAAAWRPFEAAVEGS